MIVKDKTNPEIERLKAKAGIEGDCYLINGHLLESLASHNATFHSSCQTIEEAEAERLLILEEEARQIAEIEEQERLRMLEEEAQA